MVNAACRNRLVVTSALAGGVSIRHYSFGVRRVNAISSDPNRVKLSPRKNQNGKGSPKKNKRKKKRSLMRREAEDENSEGNAADSDGEGKKYFG